MGLKVGEEITIGIATGKVVSLGATRVRVRWSNGQTEIVRLDSIPAATDWTEINATMWLGRCGPLRIAAAQIDQEEWFWVTRRRPGIVEASGIAPSLDEAQAAALATE